METNADFERLGNAMFSTAVPCNPIPFLAGLIELVRRDGSDALQTKTGRRILFTVIQMAYGQTATVDLTAEYSKLEEKL